MKIEAPGAVLDFWFGPALDDPAAATARNPLWFGKAFATDAAIAGRFLDTLAALASGLAYEWAVASPRARLAAIIALDQFSRNIFRGMPAAFGHDAMALDLASHGLMIAADYELAEIERMFFYLPFEHSERLADQETAVKALAAAEADARPGFAPVIAGALDYARQHRDVIARFRRFPHRNAVLGRTTTAEEEAWLAEHGGF